MEDNGFEVPINAPFSIAMLNYRRVNILSRTMLVEHVYVYHLTLQCTHNNDKIGDGRSYLVVHPLVSGLVHPSYFSGRLAPTYPIKKTRVASHLRSVGWATRWLLYTSFLYIDDQWLWSMIFIYVVHSLGVLLVPGSTRASRRLHSLCRPADCHQLPVVRISGLLRQNGDKWRFPKMGGTPSSLDGL